MQCEVLALAVLFGMKIECICRYVNYCERVIKSASDLLNIRWSCLVKDSLGRAQKSDQSTTLQRIQNSLARVIANT